MKLEDYARSGKYLKWQDTNIHHIALNMQFEDFKNLEPVLSDRHGTDQYEVLIVVKDVDVELYSFSIASILPFSSLSQLLREICILVSKNISFVATSLLSELIF